jgi:hypothetical protein
MIDLLDTLKFLLECLLFLAGVRLMAWVAGAPFSEGTPLASIGRALARVGSWLRSLRPSRPSKLKLPSTTLPAALSEVEPPTKVSAPEHDRSALATRFTNTKNSNN